MNKLIKLAGFFILLLSQSVCFAKDYGVYGHLFEIVEPDLLKEITGKLNDLGESGEIDKHNDVLKKRVAHSIRNPRPVEGLKRARENRSFAYDPSIEVPYDLKDQNGQVFHKAGTRVNPLDYKPLSKPLVFIDGSHRSPCLF